jgi:hypothetical protein
MSRQWSLSIQNCSSAELTTWLLGRPYAKRDGQLIALADGTVDASVKDLKPYQREDCLREWGVAAESKIYMVPARDAGAKAREAMFRVAFDALRHFTGDMSFAALDVGIFARRAGRLIVNSEEFKSAEINALLEPPFWLADDPCHLLIRAGDVGGETTDIPDEA